MNHFDIRLTAQELDYVANALAQRPWQEVNNLLSNIKEQISMQQNIAASETTGYVQQQSNGHDSNVSPINPN